MQAAEPAQTRYGAFRSLVRRAANHRAAFGHAAAISGAIFLIALLYSLAREPFSSLLQHWFYLPIVYGGYRFGWRGGFGAGLLASVCLLSPVESLWARPPAYPAVRYWETLVFCAAGILSGLMAEREWKRTRTSEQMARQLSKLCDEYRQSLERIKRTERLCTLGQLSAGLAHEIRNPLASISGAVGILRRGRSSEQKGAECLEIIQKECQRLNRLLTAFLDFARPRSPSFLTVRMVSVFDSVLGLAEHAVRGPAITLRRECPPDLMFDCDPEQLKQVLLNLLINSIQAMPEGGEVRISARAEGENVAIEVRDEGCGVGTEEMEHLYDPFFTTKENGTGLGLPVAHQIVAHLGGVLSAHNNPGRGMTFRIELPMHQSSMQ